VNAFFGEERGKMVTESNWIPNEIPTDRPSAARIYDCLLGGYHNFESDRVVCEKLIEIYPEIRLAAQVNRGFLRRAVRFFLAQGLDQFLDIGSGIPTVGNVHEVAQAINPAARIVYVDIDPVAVAHSRAILAENQNAIAIQGDVREPHTILDVPQVQSVLDFSRPVGLLLVSVLHYVLVDEMASQAVRVLGDSLAPGSYMAIAHTTPATQPAEVEDQMNETFRPASDTRSRTREQILHFFESWRLVEPGVVYTPLWHPEGPDDPLFSEPSRGLTMAGVGYI
jgi:hypothetical protein